MRRIRRSERGFALVETIVAFLVLAIGLASIGASMALAIRSDARLEARRTATQLARSRLEAAGIAETLTPGRRTGGAGKRTWSETVTAVATGPATPAGAQASSAIGLRAYWVEVTVDIGDGGAARLAALKLARVSTP